MRYIGLLTHQQKQAGYFVSQDEDFVWLWHRRNGSPECIAVWPYEGLMIKTVRDKAQAEMVDAKMADPQVGEECQVCHQETFRLQKRKVEMEADCCPRCVARIDLERENETIQEAIKTMEKSDRRLFLKEKSFKWANSLHGKKVDVAYDVSDGRGGIAKADCHIRGTAYRSNNAGGGWGQVKIVLDESELHRVSYIENHYWKNYEQVPYDKAIIDGFQWGLCLTDGWNGKEDKPLCFYVSWGMRFDYLITEIVAAKQPIV